jgi:hypothetical protein
VIISEHFNASDADSNPVLAAAIDAPSVQRRRQMLVLVGSSFGTGDEMQAFQLSVDLVVSLADVGNIRPVVRRAVVRKQEFYAPLNEAINAANAA